MDNADRFASELEKGEEELPLLSLASHIIPSLRGVDVEAEELLPELEESSETVILDDLLPDDNHSSNEPRPDVSPQVSEDYISVFSTCPTNPAYDSDTDRADPFTTIAEQEPPHDPLSSTYDRAEDTDAIAITSSDYVNTEPEELFLGSDIAHDHSKSNFIPLEPEGESSASDSCPSIARPAHPVYPMHLRDSILDPLLPEDVFAPLPRSSAHLGYGTFSDDERRRDAWNVDLEGQTRGPAAPPHVAQSVVPASVSTGALSAVVGTVLVVSPLFLAACAGGR